MKKLLFLFSLLVPVLAGAQSGIRVPFAAARTIDTSYGKGSLLIDSNVRFLKYATTDSNDVAGFDIQGNIVRRKKATAVDTTSLSNRINQRVRYSDTAAMLAPYATKSALTDTAGTLRGLINAGGANAVKYSDTASMLNPYVRKQSLQDTASSIRSAVNTKVGYGDTAAMLFPYARKSALNDTAAALRNSISSIPVIDTSSLSNRINQRVRYSDTAAMLSPYLRIAVAAITYAPISTTVTLTGTQTITSKTITAPSISTPLITGLSSGTTNDSLLVADPSTGAVKRISSSRISAGSGSLTGYTGGSATGNTAIGVDAAPGPLTDFNNTNIGYKAGESLGGGGDQVSLGSQALRFNIAGIGNTAVGAAALRSTTNNYNTGVGWRALYTNTTGTNNGAFGYQSLNNNTSGQYNYAFGSLSLYSNTDGRYNVGVGDQTIYSNTSSWYNAAIGSQALYSTTGALNVGIGYMAGSNLTTGSGNLALGASAQLPSNTADNQASMKNLLFMIGANGTVSSPAGRVGIGTSAPSSSAILDISSTSKGFLKPRMTTTERTSIPSPEEGLEVYDLTLHKDFTWDGTTWQAHW